MSNLIAPVSPIPGLNPDPNNNGSRRWVGETSERIPPSEGDVPSLPGVSKPVLGGTGVPVPSGNGGSLNGYAIVASTSHFVAEHQGEINTGLLIGGTALLALAVPYVAIPLMAEAGVASLSASAAGAAALGFGGVVLGSGAFVSAEAATNDVLANRSDPLLLDLNGDGVKTSGFADGIFFDHDNNGFAEWSTWVSREDGMLALDFNNNGIIDNGSEIFGSGTALSNGAYAANGYAALEQYDTNSDRVINNQDQIFSRLQVLKGDGTLMNLAQAGIIAINLTNNATNTIDANGNTQTAAGTFVKANMTTGQMGDFNLLINTAISNPQAHVTVPSEVASLPDMMGSGNVYDLQQAMTMDATGALKGLVNNLIVSTDAVAQNALLDKILAAWTGVAIPTAAPTGLMRSEHLDILEKFEGRNFNQQENASPNSISAALLSQDYYEKTESLYGKLMAQSQLKDYFAQITWAKDSNDNYSLNLNGVIDKIETLAATNSSAAMKVAADFSRSLIGLKWATVSNYMDFYQEMGNLGTNFKLAIDTAGKQVIMGTSGSNALGSDEAIGSFTRDTHPYYLDGGAGNDELRGSYSHDVLVGGTGNDVLQGYDGNDVYRFNIGDGKDLIIEGNQFVKNWDGGFDTVWFGNGITANTVSFSVNGTDLVIRLQGTADSITVQNQFVDARIGNHIENFVFGNGTSVSYTNAELLQRLSVQGTTDTDNLVGSQYAETISGNAGNDSLYGLNGNDTLAGGVGYDTLDGGEGNDTYVFASGDGQDRISDGEFDGGNDTLKLTNLNRSNVTFTGSGVDLLVKVNGGSDQVLIQNMLNQNTLGRWVENIVFADGSTLNRTQLLSQLQTVGTSSDDTLYGSVLAETITGQNGNDQLFGNDGNDTLTGGLGNDSLYGGNGNDLYTFVKGDGKDVIADNTGSNVIQFGSGIAKANLVFTSDNAGGVIISLTNATDTLSVFDTISNDNFSIRFNDGTTMTAAQIESSLRASTVGGPVANDTLYGTTGNNSLSGGNGNDVIYGYEGQDTLDGGNGTDTLYGNQGNDVLQGGSGNDSLYANDGNDTLTGGLGNDYLNGGVGNNLYQFNAGDGQDTILDENGTDTLQFGAGLTSTNAIFSADINGQLLVSFAGRSESVSIQDVWSPSYTTRGIETLRFGDNVTMTLSQIAAKLQVLGDGDNNSLYGSNLAESISGGEGNDNLNGYAGNDSLYGGNGNDTLYGNVGNDVLLGGNGTDTIYGNEGTDTIQGGAGTDWLYGGTGNTTYLFNIGDGNDTIQDDNGSDTVQFGSGLNSSNAIFSADINGRLTIGFDGTSETITIQDIWSPSYTTRGIETFRFGDNVTLTLNDIAAKLQLIGSASNDYLYGSNLSESISGGDGQDVLGGYVGNDTIDGGNGNDTVYGNEGNDVILGGNGNDTIYSHDGNDTIQGGVGTDWLYGGNGNDTYLFNLGDGEDSIQDDNGTDVVRFGGDLNSTNAIFSANTSGDLMVRFEGRSENLTIQGVWNTSSPTRAVETLTFGDNVSLSLNQIASQLQVIGDGNNNSLSGSSLAERLLGGDGNDNLNAYAGNDSLYGGSGNDYLYANEGDDLLVGGNGLDFLYGHAGNDTYQFGLGAGEDYVSDSAGTDTLLFDNSATASNILFFQDVSGNLQVGYTNSNSDWVTIQNQGNAANAIEQFTLSNGEFMTAAEVDTLLNEMDAYAAAHNINLANLNDVRNDANLVAMIQDGWHG
jgi:Ca2+-binding RTX toxin-like protein